MNEKSINPLTIFATGIIVLLFAAPFGFWAEWMLIGVCVPLLLETIITNYQKMAILACMTALFWLLITQHMTLSSYLHVMAKGTGYAVGWYLVFKWLDMSNLLDKKKTIYAIIIWGLGISGLWVAIKIYHFFKLYQNLLQVKMALVLAGFVLPFALNKNINFFQLLTRIRSSKNWPEVDIDGKIIKFKEAPVFDYGEMTKNWTREKSSDSTNTKPQENVLTEQKILPVEQTKGIPTSIPKFTGPHKKLLTGAWNDLVDSNLASFRESALLEAITKIFTILDTEGRMPSVVSNSRDKKEQEKEKEPSQFDIYKKITLAEHLVDTGYAVLELVHKKKIPGEFFKLPILLTAALSHDFGKLEKIRKSNYITGQHPLDGAEYVKKIIGEEHPHAQEIAELIQHHHRSPNDNTPLEQQIIIEADRMARKKELEKHTSTDTPVIVTEEKKSQPAKPDYSDYAHKFDNFPIERVLEKIRENINYLIRGKFWTAFSQPDGWVYLIPEFVYACISKTATELGIEDQFFHNEKEYKRPCLAHFYKKIAQKGWAAPSSKIDVSRDFYGTYVTIWSPLVRQNTRSYYIIIHYTAFTDNLEELEMLRKNHPQLKYLKVYGEGKHAAE